MTHPVVVPAMRPVHTAETVYVVQWGACAMPAIERNPVTVRGVVVCNDGSLRIAGEPRKQHSTTCRFHSARQFLPEDHLDQLEASSRGIEVIISRR